METSQYQLIDKEAVAALSFPEAEILKTKEEVAQRNADLNMAMSLGNLERHKIKIHFEDAEGPKVVDTTIWGVTDRRIILKQGITMPINRITRIKF